MYFIQGKIDPQFIFELPVCPVPVGMLAEMEEHALCVPVIDFMQSQLDIFAPGFLHHGSAVGDFIIKRFDYSFFRAQIPVPEIALHHPGNEIRIGHAQPADKER